MPSWLTSDAVASAWPGFVNLPADEQTALISAAMTAVENFCRRSFEQTTVTDVLNGRAGSRLWLSTRPVIQIASITVNGDAVDNTYGDAWTFNPNTGELVRGNGEDDPRFAPWFPKGTGNIVVVYFAGYNPVPDPVIRAGIIATRWYAEASKNAGLYSQERIGDYSYVLSDHVTATLPPGAAGLLAPYVQDDLA